MRVILILGMMALSAHTASAMDFTESRECVLTRANHVADHTRCLVSGGMQGGTIDVDIKTPDGRYYPLAGPVDGENGSKFMLQKRRAKIVTPVNEADGQCYARDDHQLVVCLGKQVE